MNFIRTVVAGGTIYIRTDGSIDPPTAPIQRDGNVYTFTDNIYDEIVVERDNIVVDGTGYTVQGTGNGTGIDLSGRNNVTIKNMEIKAFGYGIRLDYSSNNTVSGNKITNNDCGISLAFYSLSNSISGNNIEANNNTAITLVVSWSNSVFGNNVTNNNYGISLKWSSNNDIYHNNFIDNTEQVHIYTSGYPNSWDDDYPSGGNYWGDYAGVDSDHDGIGDTLYMIERARLYIIGEGNQDNYPLMNPWGLVEEEEEVPFWMQWWFWTIVAVVVVALAGAIYFLRKRKPPTPTAPSLPTEGTLQNTTQNTNSLTIDIPSFLNRQRDFICLHGVFSRVNRKWLYQSLKN